MDRRTAKATAAMLSRIVTDEVKLRVTASEWADGYGMTQIPDEDVEKISNMVDAADHLAAAAKSLNSALGEWRA